MLDVKKPELLMPASSLEVLKTAINYGADAVYIGGEMYGLRAKAKNFSPEDMREGIRYAHAHGKKVYVTANITAHSRDMVGVRNYFSELHSWGEDRPDAVIVSDLGVFQIAKETVYPDMEIHVSTQANTTNYVAANFWYEQGAARVVPARELSLEEITTLRANIPADMDIECFIHGAMCMSYSGRCLLSAYFTGRDANLGACTHPCRWKYYIMEETRPGEYYPVFENDRGTYIFNSKDLCMIEYIPEMVKAGINSFKIEGRMKTALYVASVARTYRQAIDDFFESEELYRKNIPHYKEEIAKCTYRQFITGFYFNKPNEESQIYDSNTYVREYTYLGLIQGKNEAGLYAIEQRNKFNVGDTIEVMKPNGDNIAVQVLKIQDEAGNDMDSCPHPKQKIFIDLGLELNDFDLLRRKEEKEEPKKEANGGSCNCGGSCGC